MTRALALLALLFAALAPVSAGAVDPGEMLKNPVLEHRAREISKELRCLVCQNENIDESDAQLAHDLRRLVRERLVAGDSDKAVIDYVVSRYGDFVLLDPPFKASTYVLWIGPAVILVLGILLLVVFFRRRSSAGGLAPPPLSADEDRRLKALLETEAGEGN